MSRNGCQSVLAEVYNLLQKGDSSGALAAIEAHRERKRFDSASKHNARLGRKIDRLRKAAAR